MEVLIKPLITEKMTNDTERFNRFGFIVDRKANKIQIKAAVEKAYGVTVDSVKTMIYAGKTKTKFTKTGVMKGKTAAFKKAIISLKDGDTIDFYSNI